MSRLLAALRRRLIQLCARSPAAGDEEEEEEAQLRAHIRELQEWAGRESEASQGDELADEKVQLHKFRFLVQ